MTDPLVTDSSLFAAVTHEITFFDVHTGHPYAQCWDPEWKLDTAFIEDGAKLAPYSGSRTIRIRNIVDLAAKHRNVVHGYESVPQGMKDGWMVGQDDELLF